MTEVKFEYSIIIQKKLEEVWEYLTKKEHVAHYYFVPLMNDITEVGQDMNYGFEDEVAIACKVLDIERNKKLVHSFRFSNNTDDPETEVTYLLEEKDNDTEVILIHKGFPDENQTYTDVSGGWPVILQNLKSFIETGRINEDDE